MMFPLQATAILDPLTVMRVTKIRVPEKRWRQSEKG